MRLLSVAQSAERLLAGDLVAIPTETVYGLAAHAHDEAAVHRVFEAKGRPTNHPLIVHVGDVKDMTYWAKVEHDYVYHLIDTYCPGPLTLVCQKQPHVLPIVTGGRETVAIRVPRQVNTQELLCVLRASGCYGLVAPSANRFGHVSPTLPEHVFDDFSDQLAGVLIGEACSYGIESTILDVTQATPRLLRQGRISAKAIESVIGLPVATTPAKKHEASGTLPGHYAPSVPLFFSDTLSFDHELIRLENQGKVGVMSLKTMMPIDLDQRTNLYWTCMPSVSASYAYRLYERLRFFEKRVDFILVESLPEDSSWDDIRDRLLKASFGSNHS